MAASASPSHPPHFSHTTQGFAFGALGVLMFALTLPMTRLAVGAAADPQLPPAFVTAGRAAVAGVLSVLFLLAVRAPWPRRHHWWPLLFSALGTVVGFPLTLALALRLVDATHAAVVTGLMPLSTALIGALVTGQRPSAGFWACACTGCALVVAFAAWRGGGALSAGDGLLLLAVLFTGMGYVAGARVAADKPASEVICWVLVISLPLTLPAALWLWPAAPVRAALQPSAWLGFAYVSLFSMWLGFFAWYRGLALGGVVRVSQVQLVQPFLAMMFAVPILGERLDAMTVVFAVAVIAVVLIGKRMPVIKPSMKAKP
jgi:drug/metabolite transporter (DMT)-like permease